MNDPNRLPSAVRRHFVKGTTKTQMNHHLVEAKELRFELPYGHLAAKEWGDPNGLPVLAVHGWLDNAGSCLSNSSSALYLLTYFLILVDPLVPYILKPHNLHIVAIDHPGCGLSSHKPAGSEYGRWNTLVEMKRVIDAMKWSKCTLIGHSLGIICLVVF